MVISREKLEGKNLRSAFLRYKYSNLNIKKRGGMTYDKFYKISKILIELILERLIASGENMWFFNGELAIRRFDQTRAFHRAFIGIERKVVQIPILSDYYYKILMLHKRHKGFAVRGCKLVPNQKTKMMINDTVEENGELFYKKNSKLWEDII